jgi:hypothetical protein
MERINKGNWTVNERILKQLYTHTINQEVKK